METQGNESEEIAKIDRKKSTEFRKWNGSQGLPGSPSEEISNTNCE